MMKQRKRRLRLKFIFGFFLYGLIGFLLISTFGARQVENLLVRSTGKDLYEQAREIASDYPSYYAISLEERDLYYDGIANGLDADIWIMDRQGTVIYDSAGKYKDKAIPDFDPASFGQITLLGISYMEKGNFYDTFPTETLSVMATIYANYQTRGYVLIHKPMSALFQSQYDMLNIVYLACLAVFLLSLLIMVFYHFIIAVPLEKISKAADEYAAGNLKYECPVHTNDEMGYLSATLNYMASELNHTEEYQKQFISNVSHDFRSPLTSIRGYLVAILDGTIPQEFYEKYIGIIIRETDRLTKLTEGLLTLNKLGSGNQTKLNLSDFDINRVIKNTCATFEGRCRSRNITFHLTFEEKLMTVHADAGRIEQVIYNLVDNAIKFSNNDSHIDITTSEKNGKVFVSVKDHGLGISKADQKKIFDRFYKADNSRGRDKQGTGLGLAITKEIISAHNQTIDVISTPGAGTEFIFTLAKK